jgi:hypothetical protein
LLLGAILTDGGPRARRNQDVEKLWAKKTADCGAPATPLYGTGRLAETLFAADGSAVRAAQQSCHSI